jgi:hypothetical protein
LLEGKKRFALPSALIRLHERNQRNGLGFNASQVTRNSTLQKAIAQLIGHERSHDLLSHNEISAESLRQFGLIHRVLVNKRNSRFVKNESAVKNI